MGGGGGLGALGMGTGGGLPGLGGYGFGQQQDPSINHLMNMMNNPLMQQSMAQMAANPQLMEQVCIIFLLFYYND